MPTTITWPYKQGLVFDSNCNERVYFPSYGFYPSLETEADVQYDDDYYTQIGFMMDDHVPELESWTIPNFGWTDESDDYNEYGIINGRVVRWCLCHTNGDEDEYFLYPDEVAHVRFFEVFNPFWEIWQKFEFYHSSYQTRGKIYLSLDCKNHYASELQAEFAYTDLKDDLKQLHDETGLNVVVNCFGRSGGHLCITMVDRGEVLYGGLDQDDNDDTTAAALDWFSSDCKLDLKKMPHLTKALNLIYDAVENFKTLDSTDEF